MNTTYMQRLAADEAKIEEETPFADMASAVARAGRYSGTAHYYAHCADFEAAQRQRIGRDPKALISVFTGQVGGPSAADFAILLQELHVYLRLRPELEDADFHVEHAAAEMQAAADREAQRREEDLDAQAAAASDEAYDRKIDAGLIGRSDFMPEAVKA